MGADLPEEMNTNAILLEILDELRAIREMSKSHFCDCADHGENIEEIERLKAELAQTRQVIKDHLEVDRKHLCEKIAALESQLSELLEDEKVSEELHRQKTEMMYKYEDEVDALSQQLASCKEAIQRFIPVLRWLERCDEETVGRDLAKQLTRIMEKALSTSPTEK